MGKLYNFEMPETKTKKKKIDLEISLHLKKSNYTPVILQQQILRITYTRLELRTSYLLHYPFKFLFPGKLGWNLLYGL